VIIVDYTIISVNNVILVIRRSSAMQELKKIETSKAPKALGPYSQAVYAPPFVFVSGQVGIDPATGKLAEATIRLQIQRVFDNLEAILKESGCSFANVVRYEIFLKDLNDFTIVNEECAKRFMQPILPARQTVQVARLPLDALVEISCIAFRG
jgi:2-iminobutanoate/2-iminopropanoate deaminase